MLQFSRFACLSGRSMHVHETEGTVRGCSTESGLVQTASRESSITIFCDAHEVNHRIQDRERFDLFDAHTCDREACTDS